jgi:peptide-methionine (R)-S-oxide reductase
MILNWNIILKLASEGNVEPPRREEKTEAEWSEILDEEEFYVTRKHGTERPGSGAFCTSFDPGIYGCKCCKTVLFDSNTKFESGTGWPSFTLPLSDNVIKYILDNSLSRERVETQCNVCDAHLGHVFPDGPEPSGLRFCMNSVALEKVG